MIDNHLNLIEKVKFHIHPPIEYLTAIHKISQEENLKERFVKFNFTPSKEYFKKLNYLSLNTSRYIKQESNYFFENGRGIGDSIWFKLIINNMEINSVAGILDLLQKLDSKKLIHYVISSTIENYKEGDDLYNQIMKSKTIEETMKQKLCELLENPIEIKQRFYLMMSQFYEKSYKNIEKEVLKELEKYKEDIENRFNDNSIRFFKKRFHMELKEQTENINIFISYFRQIGFNYYEHNNEIWIIMGIYSDYLNEEKIIKDKMLKFYKILSDRNRINILMHLNQRPWFVNELGEKLGLTAPTISYHISLFLELDIVYFKREEHRLYYSLNKEKVKQLFEEGMLLILEEK